MYFVDRNKITEQLNYMDELLEVYEKQSSWTTTALEKLAFERIVQVVIESMIDVGNSMIDGFIMRDPGSYEDIVDIMDDEEVITDEMVEPIKAVVAMRKALVSSFTTLDYEEMDRQMKKSLPALKEWSARVTHYLENELGPVSAFLPEDKQ